MTRFLRLLPTLNRLDIRVMALLGLALLPIGLIAMVQTYRVIDAANAQTEDVLLSQTSAAASSERETILKGIGMAEAAVRMAGPLRADPAACSERLRDLIARDDAMVFAGYVDAGGVVTCGSEGLGADLSQSAVYQRYRDDPREKIESTPAGQVTGQSVIVVIEPAGPDPLADGYFALSIPHDALIFRERRISGPIPLDTITFNREGTVLTAKLGREGVAARLPRSVSLDDLVDQRPRSFRGMTVGGEARLFTYAPLYEGSIFALSVWRLDAALAGAVTASTAVVFPALMWLASLGVAYFAVHRQVIRHIDRLRQQIRAFATARTIPVATSARDTPNELFEVIEAFQTMADRIVRDEADLEDGLHEKDVLLKEVHHRVKNNLQLIASITNMQIRTARSPETKLMLRRLQDRVLGLATIHRNLYQASVLSDVRADTLITELTEQLSRTAIPAGSDIRFDVEVEPVSLYPDQAVPLSLMLTEAVTNALKYIGRPPGGRPWVSVSLTVQPDRMVRLAVRNSLGEPLERVEGAAISGLGTQLMNAFVMQLGATSLIQAAEGVFVVEATFMPSNFAPEPDAV